MANALIGKLNPDSSVSCIYCHMHGAPGETGKQLVSTYTKHEDIDSLFSQGHIPSLQIDTATASRSHRDWCQTNWEECLPGHRPLSFPTQQDFLNAAQARCVFAYLFKNDFWQYINLESRQPRFQKISSITTDGFGEKNRKRFRLFPNAENKTVRG